MKTQWLNIFTAFMLLSSCTHSAIYSNNVNDYNNITQQATNDDNIIDNNIQSNGPLKKNEHWRKVFTNQDAMKWLGIVRRKYSKHRIVPEISEYNLRDTEICSKIDINGIVYDVNIVNSSGSDIYDKIFVEGLKKISPVPPPPKIMLNGRNHVVICISERFDRR